MAFSTERKKIYLPRKILSVNINTFSKQRKTIRLLIFSVKICFPSKGFFFFFFFLHDYIFSVKTPSRKGFFSHTLYTYNKTPFSRNRNIGGFLLLLLFCLFVCLFFHILYVYYTYVKNTKPKKRLPHPTPPSFFFFNKLYFCCLKKV